MSSDVQIAKLALSHIGDHYDISSLDESVVEAEIINLHFTDVRDATLRAHPWNFAKKYISPSSLVATTAVPVPGNWDYMYAYPADALWMRSIVDPLESNEPIRFEVAINAADAKVILTDQEDAEFIYTMRVTDPVMFDPEFIMAFSYMLGANAALALTGDGGISSQLEQKARSLMVKAEVDDSNEGTEEEKPEASWIEARK